MKFRKQLDELMAYWSMYETLIDIASTEEDQN